MKKHTLVAYLVALPVFLTTGVSNAAQWVKTMPIQMPHVSPETIFPPHPSIVPINPRIPEVEDYRNPCLSKTYFQGNPCNQTIPNQPSIWLCSRNKYFDEEFHSGHNPSLRCNNRRDMKTLPKLY